MPYTAVSPFTPSIRPKFTVVWDYLDCESECHRVAGSFYTDAAGVLPPGYPC
jgi:hypothetical protein